MGYLAGFESRPDHARTIHKGVTMNRSEFLNHKRIDWKDDELTRTVTVKGREAVYQRLCEWFAMCERPATHFESHPVLGDVPACDRCVNIGR